MPSKNNGIQKERIKVDVQTKNPGIFRYRGSQSGGYLLSHNAVQYHRRCCLSLLPRAQPTPRMAHTAPHSATPPPMRHTRGGKRRLFLPGQKRYGLSQKRNIGLSIFITFLGGAVTDFLPIQWKDAPGLSFFRATAGRARV